MNHSLPFTNYKIKGEYQNQNEGSTSFVINYMTT